MLYDEQLVASIISRLSEAESILDESCIQLQSIVNSDGYYAKTTSGLTNLKELLTLHSEFSSFISNAKAIYDMVYADIKESVDDIEQTSLGIVYDAFLGELGWVDQRDSRWSNMKYGTTTVGSGGCGPSSVVNGLIVTFGITDPATIQGLVSECVKLSGPGSNVTEYLVNPSKRSDKYPTLNYIIDNAGGPIYYAGGSGKSVRDYILANPPQAGEKVYIFGKMSFQSGGGKKDNGYQNVLDIVDTLYEVSPDSNLTFYGMCGGQQGRAFGSSSNSGHYVSLLVNVRDFKENGTVYLLDSYPRSLEGETDTENLWGKYNFVATPHYGDLGKFNSTYEVTRVSRDVLKVKLRNGESFNSQNLHLLGLSGGTQVAYSNNPTSFTASNSTNNTIANASARYEATLGDSMPTYSPVTDTTEENTRTMTRVMANRNRTTEQVTPQSYTASATEGVSSGSSRISGGLLDILIPSAEAEGSESVPEEYNFPTEQSEGSTDVVRTGNAETREQANNEPVDGGAGGGNEQETPQAQEETTEIVGVMPSITARSNTTPSTSPTTSSQVTVTGDTNPNGYTVPTETTEQASTTPRYTASAGRTTATSGGTTGVASATPITSSSDTSVPTETPVTAEASVPSQNSAGQDQPVTTNDTTTTTDTNSNVVVNDSAVTKKKTTSSSSGNSNSSNTNKVLGGVGATLIAAGTTTLILNSNPSNYKVELKGSPEVTINLYDNYVDEGCKVYEDDQELDLKTNVKMNLDNTTPGTYKMTCSLGNDSKTRYINVRQANDNVTVGNVDIYYNDNNVLPSVNNDIEVETTTTYTISYNNNVSYIKYCVTEYGEKCNVDSEEKHNGDTFKINETGKRVIYIEKYSNGNMVKEVRYINIK